MTDNPPVKAAPRLHLSFLDGLRGLAALYVALSHASLLLLGAARQLSTLR